MTTPLEILEQGIEQWNLWRSQRPETACSLARQDLSHGYFFEGDFRNVDLKGAKFCRACLVGADFRGADLSGADLTGAYLADANFQGANLKDTDLSNAQLDRADMRSANLFGTQLNDADISTAKLSDPNQNRYVDEVALLLKQPSLTPLGQLVPPIDKPAENVAKGKKVANSQRVIVKEKQALNHNSRQRFVKSRSDQSRFDPSRSWDRRKDDADRRQSIRQSTFVPSKKGERASTRWGRRREDQASAVLPSQYASRRGFVRPLMMVSAAVVAAMGLPLMWNYAQLPVQSDSPPPEVELTSSSDAAVASSIGRAGDPWGRGVEGLSLVASLTSDRDIESIAAYARADATPGVIAGTADGHIELWDVQTQQRLSTLTGHADSVSALSVSRDGRWLVSGGLDGLSLWQLETGDLIHHIPQFDSGVAAVAISSEHNVFISSDRVGSVTVWDLRSGEQRYQIDSGSAVGAIVIAPDGQSFFTGRNDSMVNQWTVATGSQVNTFEGHRDAVRSLALSDVTTASFDSTTSTLVRLGDDNTIKVWR